MTIKQTAAGVAIAIAVALGVLLVAASPASAASATLTAQPSAQTLSPGGQVFTVAINANADVITTGTQTDLAFDHNRLQINSLALGPAYAGAALIVGVAPNNTVPLAIADANSSGTLENLAAYFSPGTGSVPAGPHLFATITLQTRPNSGGSSPIDLAQTQVIDDVGASVPSSGQDSMVTITGPITVGGVVETVTGATGGDGDNRVWLLAGLTALVGFAVVGAGVQLKARRSSD